MTVLGVDIGGASLKAATTDGWAKSVRFALWREPERLPEVLADLVAEVPHERVAITMTGELCDAFVTKEEGVRRILDSAVEALGDERRIHVWSNLGRFLTVFEAKKDAWHVASANWLATATYSALRTPGAALFIDIGSTTTDIVLLQDNVPQPKGRTDPERLSRGELVYQGVRRTPLCSLLRGIVIEDRVYGIMNELFATSLDAYLVAGKIGEDANSNETADGRAETVARAINRMAKMIGSDETRFSRENAFRMALEVWNSQVNAITRGIRQVLSGYAGPPIATIVACGEGEFLIPEIQRRTKALREATIHNWSTDFSPELSRAASAYAVAALLDRGR